MKECLWPVLFALVRHHTWMLTLLSNELVAQGYARAAKKFAVSYSRATTHPLSLEACRELEDWVLWERCFATRGFEPLGLLAIQARTQPCDADPDFQRRTAIGARPVMHAERFRDALKSIGDI